ncbi:glycoside hydrolase family 3 N-terminal domain-containing protein [Conexibacter arvalis]|uniref:Beta-N-acetylhexosaminidase n=1 Tax=Conexibacter arvalis TaxID=912552 RepID=A0A840IBB3_9ACTN|nr:glycoside hydrolase family 3 N-terminal domain-containing protein [Conexibacter arvalis]MBB4661922.1 beta-N-acetylhexosaminidase [Conexibacter arvalis]
MPHRRRSTHGPTAIRRRQIALVLVALLALAAGIAIGAGSGGDGDGRAGGSAATSAGAPGASGGGQGAGGSRDEGAPTGGDDAAGTGEGGAPADDESAGGGEGGAPAGEDAAGGDAAAAERARGRVERMSLERQVGELLVISFSGTTPPQYVLDALRGRRAAGVILFGPNAPSAASVRALSARVQRAAGGDAIVSLDQEGGDIRTLKFAPPQRGQASQPGPAAAAASARAAARALRQVGVNVTLGPVADVALAPGSFMASRVYRGGPEEVGRSVAAAVGAYRRAGIETTPKHFPGVGAATQNTDFGSAAIDRTRAQLLAEELVPFRAAIDAGARLVMVGHARMTGIDPGRIASQSRAVVRGLLRDELGFDGVVMTDSLEAEAVDAATPGDRDVGAAAVRSLAAGCDLLLLTGAGSFPLAREALIAAARADRRIRARVAESAARVLLLRERLAQREG